MLLLRELNYPKSNLPNLNGIVNATDYLSLKDHPDIAIMTVGGKYNMGYREAAYAASLILPEYVIPTHYGTCEDQQLNMDDFQIYNKALCLSRKWNNKVEGNELEIHGVGLISSFSIDIGLP